MFHLGIIAESFQRDFEESARLAKELGADGLQVYATEGRFDPYVMTERKRAQVRGFLQDMGLEISALCGDMGGHGFAVAEDNTLRVEKSKRILELALSLGTRIVTTHIGVIPESARSERYQVMADAMRSLGEYAESAGGVFAIETGPEKAETLRRFLEYVDSDGIGVNYDPANLYMVAHDDEVAGVQTLGKYIVHTHAKDGLRGRKYGPEQVYGFFAEGGIGDMNLAEYFTETPLGKGGVRFTEYVAALREVGYSGYLTVEREITGNPYEDIALAVDFLRPWTGKEN